MLDAIKQLLEAGLVNEETRAQIQSDWDEMMVETREGIRAELRTEFAGRYEHDRNVMAEALDKMVTESLATEIADIRKEKQSIERDRVKTMEGMKTAAKTFESFLTKTLAKEIKELHEDRKTQRSSIKQLETFVAESLATEISEFATDKQAVVETKVRLIAEAKTQLDTMKSRFVKRSAALVKESVTEKLTTELTQLKEDIQVARENQFGRKIFEAVATEFGTSFLSENLEMKKIADKLATTETKLKESNSQVAKATKLAESKESKLKAISEGVARNKAMAKLLKPLQQDKANVMESLLENVATDRLTSAFDKYLPAVLKESATKQTQRTVVTEGASKAVTGNKETTSKTDTAGNSNIIEIKRLAGLK